MKPEVEVEVIVEIKVELVIIVLVVVLDCIDELVEFENNKKSILELKNLKKLI